MAQLVIVEPGSMARLVILIQFFLFETQRHYRCSRCVRQCESICVVGVHNSKVLPTRDGNP